MDLDEEVDQVRAHVPTQLGLLIDELGIRHRLTLRRAGEDPAVSLNPDSPIEKEK